MRSGDPNGEGLAQWTPGGKSKNDSMILDADTVKMGNPGFGHLIRKTLIAKFPGL